MSKFKFGDRTILTRSGKHVEVIEVDNTPYNCDLPYYVRHESGRLEWCSEDELDTNTSTLITTILTEVSSRANQEYPELRSMLDQLVIAARIEALDEAISNINQIKQR